MSPIATARRLVLVTGVTRSGTSMAAGTLQQLGLHVPLPVLKPNDSNPKGFFESTWPLRFHRRLMDACLVRQTDVRPQAFDLMTGTVSPDARARLRGWLEDVFAGADQVVVKDPRALWVPGLWSTVAEELGIRIGFVIMIRHPAEVVASRSTYYASRTAAGASWVSAVRDLGYWINGNVGLEHRTRNQPRMIVRYEDLLADWRSVMRRVRDGLGLELGPLLEESDGHQVDAFIDPALRRHAPSWADLGLPAELVSIADGAWQALAELADLADPRAHDGTAHAELDTLGAEYARFVALAEAIAWDTYRARRARAARRAEAAVDVDRRALPGQPASRRARPSDDPVWHTIDSGMASTLRRIARSFSGAPRRSGR